MKHLTSKEYAKAKEKLEYHFQLFLLLFQSQHNDNQHKLLKVLKRKFALANIREIYSL
jgi:hypothetical protein